MEMTTSIVERAGGNKFDHPVTAGVVRDGRIGSSVASGWPYEIGSGDDADEFLEKLRRTDMQHRNGSHGH